MNTQEQRPYRHLRACVEEAIDRWKEDDGSVAPDLIVDAAVEIAAVKWRDYPDVGEEKTRERVRRVVEVLQAPPQEQRLRAERAKWFEDAVAELKERMLRASRGLPMGGPITDLAAEDQMWLRLARIPNQQELNSTGATWQTLLDRGAQWPEHLLDGCDPGPKTAEELIFEQDSVAALYTRYLGVCSLLGRLAKYVPIEEEHECVEAALADLERHHSQFEVSKHPDGAFSIEAKTDS